MDFKLFLLVGLCCIVRAQCDMRDKAMQALQTGQARRPHSRFGRNFEMPPIVDEEKQLNEIPNTIPGQEEGLEEGMADSKWHLPLDDQIIKYLWSRKARST